MCSQQIDALAGAGGPIVVLLVPGVNQLLRPQVEPWGPSGYDFSY